MHALWCSTRPSDFHYVRPWVSFSTFPLKSRLIDALFRRAALRSTARAILLLVTFLMFATSTVYVVLSLRLEVLSLTPGVGVTATSWGLSSRELALTFLPTMNVRPNFLRALTCSFDAVP